MANTARQLFRLRSFVRRDGRMTSGQSRAYAELLPSFGLSVQNGLLNYEQVFDRAAPRLLEIGFGLGQSLLAAATTHPDKDFIGVETHKPGIGALCVGIENQQLTNLRMFYADVIDVLEKAIPDASLDGVQIFFPDPWPKRRHHPRRLVQSAFITLILTKLKPGASLHLATDWQDYAQHMLSVLSAETQLINVCGTGQFSPVRSPYRPVISKFEHRALREGRAIWDLQFAKQLVLC